MEGAWGPAWGPGPILVQAGLPEYTLLAGKHRREQQGLGTETLQKEAAISLPAHVTLSLNWPLICFLCFQRAFMCTGVPADCVGCRGVVA